MKSFLDRLNAHNNVSPKIEVKKKTLKPVVKKETPKPAPKPEVKKETLKPVVKKEVKKETPKPAPKPEVKKEVKKESPKPEAKKDLTPRQKLNIEKSNRDQQPKPEHTVKTFTRPAKPIPTPKVEVKESKNAIDNPKVSIVVQSYLQDYPDSRSEPIYKMKRMIASFLNQTYTNSELIIVSDGCKVTHDLWINELKGISRIKYAYVDKPDGDNMYETKNGERLYRGTPRAIGVTLATGDIITYADTDDFLMNYFCEMIVAQHRSNPNSDWMFNTAWFDHKSAIEVHKDSQVLKPYDNARIIKVPNINNEIFIETKVKDGMVVNSPWLLSHMSHCNVKWLDSYGSISEDTLFGRTLRQKYTNGHSYSSPTYLRCHYRNAWDV